MATRRRSLRSARKGPRSLRPRRIGWLAGLGIVLAVLITVALVWFRQRSQFFLESGERSPIVLIRNDEELVYGLRYEGTRPVNVDRFRVMFQGAVIHVDVLGIELTRGDEVFVLGPTGQVPPDQTLTLEPGDEFSALLKLKGRSIGGNYLYGFRIDFHRGGRQMTFDLELGEEYTVFVE